VSVDKADTGWATESIEWRGDPIKQFNRDSRTFSSKLVFMTLKCEVADEDEPIKLPILVLNTERPQQIEVIAGVKGEPIQSEAESSGV
jgi:hypothetical protein